MNKKGIRGAFPILLVLSVITTLCFLFYVNTKVDKVLLISHESGIYNEALSVTVEVPKAGTILYTTNGEVPQMGDEDTQEYKGPIQLVLEEGTMTHSFQFSCVFEDGSMSDVYHREYIIAPSGEECFATTYLVNIVGDEEELFSYEQGIFERGPQFDEYVAANPDADLTNLVPANYLEDKEVAVHAAIFDAEGTQIIEQNCGLKIYGNVTRAKNQKSFRLIARTIYDSVNEFSYELLPNMIATEGNSVIDDYQRISFHNSGNDNGYGFVRSALIGEMARQAQYQDVLVSETATVYMNGRYLGVYWLQNAFDDRYFKEKYGTYAGEMVVCEGSLSTMKESEAETDLEQNFAKEYNEFCQWVGEADLQQNANWERVCNTIDVENFAKYIAIEYYVGNLDWPQNNVKVYRYSCDEGENYREDSVFDGKYRYLLFDTDYGMGLQVGWQGMDKNIERLESLTVKEGDNILFASLLERDEFKNMFVNEVLCMVGDDFTKARVEQVLNELNDKRYEELKYMLEETDILDNSLWAFDVSTMEYAEEEWNKIIDFAEGRPQTVLGELTNLWGYGEQVYLSVHSLNAGTILLSNVNVGQDYEGNWLRNVPIEVSCDTNPGMDVEGYYVNGIYLEGTTISFMPEDVIDVNGNIIVEPYIQEKTTESLTIAEYRIDGTDDYIILQNNGQTTIMLSDYALSDDVADLSKGTLPEVLLGTGEEFVVYGRKYSGEMVENSVQVPFAWSEDENIILYHDTNGIIETRY